MRNTSSDTPEGGACSSHAALPVANVGEIDGIADFREASGSNTFRHGVVRNGMVIVCESYGFNHCLNLAIQPGKTIF